MPTEPVSRPGGWDKAQMPEPTPEDRTRIYDVFEEFVTPTCSRRGSLHLPNDDPGEDVLCTNQFSAEGFRVVPVGVFPPGYREVCRHCYREWLQSEEVSHAD